MAGPDDYADLHGGRKARPRPVQPPPVRFCVLGPLEVVDDDQRIVDLATPKLRTLVCRLLLEAGQVVPLDALVDAVWGEKPPATATATLHTYVSRLRRVLEPGRPSGAPGEILLTRPSGYLISTAVGDLDADELTQRVEAGERVLGDGRAAEAVDLLAGARALWRGRPYSDVADQPFAAAAVARLEQLRLRTLELEMDSWLAVGRTAAAVAELERLVRDHPVHERLWAQLVVALYRTERQADALAAYARCRVILREELGLDPSPQLQALERDVLDHAAWLAVPNASASDRRDARPGTVARRAPPEPAEPGNEPPMVGRESERDRLTTVVDDVLAGRGSLVTIEGEAGIGKSRLATAATRLARDHGLATAWAVCLDEIGSPPLWPWHQVQDQLRASPDTAPVDGAPAKGPDPSGEGDRRGDLFHQLSAVVEHIVDAARRRPLLVVVDDVQWADQASLQVIRLLAGRVEQVPLAVVLTVRRPEISTHPALEAMLADLVRSPAHRRLRLAGLDAVRAGTLLAAVSGRDAMRWARRLTERTGGNPFFLTETGRLLRAEIDHLGDLGVDTVDTLIPDTVREVVARRVGRLPDDTQTLLRLAALAVTGIELPVLEHATGLGTDQVCTRIEPAVEAGLLVELDDRIGWRFGHALAQDAVRAALSRATRARLHAVLADSLEHAHAASLDEHLDALAHHTFEADRFVAPDAALRWSTDAALDAHQRHGYDRAAFHWGHVLSILERERAEGTDRYEVLVHLAEDLRLMGDPDGARTRLDEALRIARDLGDDDKAARAAVVFGGATLWYWRPYGNHDPDMVAEVQRLAESATGARRAELLGTVGVELYYSRSRAQGITAAQEGLALARRLGDVPLLGRALNNYALAMWEPANDDRRRAVVEEALTLVGTGLPLQTEVIARMHRAAVNLRLADVRAARADLDRCQGIAAELAVPELRAALRYAAGGMAMLQQDWPALAALADEAFELQSRTSLWGAEWARVMQLVPLHLALGSVSTVVDDVVRIAHRPGMDATRPLAALAVAAAGDIQEARRLARLWWDPDVQPDWTTDHRTADWAVLAARIAYPEPQLMYERLLPFQHRLVVAGTAVACRGPVHTVLADVAEALGNEDGVQRHRALAERCTRSLAL